MIRFDMEYKVVAYLDAWKGNRNLHLAVRLYFFTAFRNVDIENIYATVLVVVLLGNCRKNFFRFFSRRQDLVAYKGRALFKASAVHNDTVFVLQKFKCVNLLVARRKGKCKNGN